MSTLSRAHVRLLIGVLAATLACALDPVSGNSLDAVGHWTLQTYNGSATPAMAVSSSGTTIEVMSGTLDLNDDGLYHMVTSYRMRQGGVETLSSDPGTGNWVQRGTQVTLARGGGVSDAPALYEGNKLTLFAPAESGGLLQIVYTR